jgi:cytidyltransferase-like protein
MTSVAVSGSFDDPRSRHVRFLDEAAKIGDLHVMLWSDEVAAAIDGKPPKFPLAERKYFIEAIKFVRRVSVVERPGERDVTAAGEEFCVMDSVGGRKSGRVISEEKLKIFPTPPAAKSISAVGRKKVLVTGCFDWVHTGHVRFFEEVSELGDVYAVVGSDANIELLKGAGHPLFRQDERCYMVGALRYVKLAVVSTGKGWLDAEPEIRVIRPDAYAVNEDGDKPEKRKFCEENGIEYIVLKREPKRGLTRRQSTALRGF